MSDTSRTTHGGIGVTGLLGVLFVALKLTGVIDWSWWWVTTPFWGPFVVVGLILLAIGVVYLVSKAGGYA